MKISKISLVNFRNYSNETISFENGLNIFLGNNAQGKTNILEGITLLALTKSHRIGVSPNIIQFGKEKCKISGIVKKDKIVSKLEVEISEDSKKLRINKTDIKKVADYISSLNIIIFTPDDLEIVKGSPNVRRNLLNIQLSQLSKEYLNYYNEYNKLLKTRNEYLKTINIDKYDNNYLEVINNQLCDKASYIYKYRVEYINNLNKYMSKISKEISNKNVNIKYLNNIDTDNYENIKDILLNKLNSNLKREILVGTTLYGPHKDDFVIYIDRLEAKEYGSQGQQRMCVLCIKFSELELYNEKKNEYPILLLDDIFSELDNNKKNAIVKYLKNNIQVFITSTDINDIDSKILKDSKIYTISNGNIIMN
jgi:DNA replication and repair protein RecF